MACLVRDSRGRSPFWYCSYTTAEGRRLKKSTGIRIKPIPGELREDGKLTTTADMRSRALEVCLGIQRAERMAAEETLTEQAVKKVLSEILERATGAGIPTVSAEQWLNDWLGEKRRVRTASTMERYALCVRDFIASLDQRAKLPVQAITTGDVVRYRNSDLDKGKSPGTVRLNVVVLSTAFNAARRRGLIDRNPCEAVEHPPAQKAERQSFTREQVVALVAAAEGDWRGAILTGFYTGARLGDIAALRWENVDLEKRVITFTPKKTAAKGKTLVVPLHDDLERELLRRPGVGKAPLFPSLIGKKTGGAHGLSRSFAMIMDRAGIRPEIIRHTDRGRRNTSLSFHSLRHAFVSCLANAGVGVEMRQALAGHASAAMNLAYTHRELAPLRAAVSVLPSVTDGSVQDVGRMRKKGKR